MKTLLTLAGVAAGGALLYTVARRRKAKPLTFAGKAMVLGARIAALSAIGYRALKCEAESLKETFDDASKQTVKAWNSPPRLSIKFK